MVNTQKKDDVARATCAVVQCTTAPSKAGREPSSAPGLMQEGQPNPCALTHKDALVLQQDEDALVQDTGCRRAQPRSERQQGEHLLVLLQDLLELRAALVEVLYPADRRADPSKTTHNMDVSETDRQGGCTTAMATLKACDTHQHEPDGSGQYRQTIAYREGKGQRSVRPCWLLPLFTVAVELASQLTTGMMLCSLRRRP